MKKFFIILLLLSSVLCFSSYENLYKKDNNFIYNLKTKNINNSSELNGEECLNDFDIESILFGKWKIICLYTILPSVFEFDQFSSFDNYDEINKSYCKKNN